MKWLYTVVYLTVLVRSTISTHSQHSHIHILATFTHPHTHNTHTKPLQAQYIFYEY